MLFNFSTRMGEHTLSAGTSDKRMYWLSQLQRARREYSQAGAAAVARGSMACQVSSIIIRRVKFEFDIIFPYRSNK